MVSARRAWILAAAWHVQVVSSAAASGTNTYNFATKSINLDLAPAPKFWTVVEFGTSETPAVYGSDWLDPNAVHGAGTPDGGVVHAGIAASSSFAPADAFAAKFTASGNLSWGWKSNRPGLDLANAVCVLPGSGDIIIAGVASTSDGTAHRALFKLKADGTYVWTATFGDTPTSNGAFEMCEVGKDSMIFAGIGGMPEAQSFRFKSYGNIECQIETGCKGMVMKIPLSALEIDQPPSMSTPGVLTRDFEGMQTSKAARELANGDVAAVFLAFNAPGFYLTVVDANLVEKWMLSTHTDVGHEATDLTISEDQSQLLVSGHGSGTVENRGQGAQLANTYQGFISTYSVADGSKLWTKSYGAGGNPLIIYNECWGISTVPGGYILTCGTGIECEPGSCCRTQALKTGTLLSSGLYEPEDQCLKGMGDSRPGAIARPPGKWNSMVIKTDKQGNLLWQRVDGTLAADGTSPATASSAAEFSVTTSKGIFVQTDLDSGIGLLYLEFPPTPPMECKDDDVAFAAAVGEGEQCTYYQALCATNADMRNICKKTCCTCPGRRLQGNSCAAESDQHMTFDSVWPMSWVQYGAGIQAAIQAVKGGTSLTAAQKAIYEPFAKSMALQTRTSIATTLGLPLKETDGLCVHLFGDPKMVNMDNEADSCGPDINAMTDSTTTAVVGSDTDGLGLSARITRQTMLMILHPGTQTSDKSNADLMTEVMARVNRDFAFSYAGVVSSSKCKPYKYSSFGGKRSSGTSRSSNSPVTCLDAKKMFQFQKCCGFPSKPFQWKGSNTTCGAFNALYKAQGCCGSPSKLFQ